MQKFFSQAFPPMSDVKSRLWSAFAIGLFIFLFLQIFQPFGIASIQGSVILVTLGYGVITTVAILIANFGLVNVIPSFYHEEQWTLGREIIHNLIILFLVSLGNLIYTVYLGFFSLSFGTFLLFLGFTMVVGLFPIFIQALIRMNYAQKKYVKQSRSYDSTHGFTELNISNELIDLLDIEDNVVLRITGADLVYLESADNYVKVHLDNSEKKNSEMIRTSLKKLEQELPQQFFRCHRSYIINLSKIKTVDGNARGLILQLEGDFSSVPVSRSKLDEFNTRFNASH